MADRGVSESPLVGEGAPSIEGAMDDPSTGVLLRALAASKLGVDALLAIADALPVMVAYVDVDLVYRFCNKAVTDWFERPRGAIIGRPLREILGEAAFAQREPALRAALAGTAQRCVASFDHPARGPLTTSSDYTPHFSPGGQVVGVVLIVSDITEQKLAELALRESEMRFRRIADSTPVPVWVTRADSSLDFANHAFKALFAEAASDWRTLLHPDDRPLLDAAVEAAASGRIALSARMATGGDYRWFEISAEPRRDAEGRDIGCIGAAVDITAAKLGEQALRRQVDERTRQLNENQGRFRAIFDSVTTLLVLMDVEGRILEVNNTPAPWRNSRLLDGIGGMLWESPTIQDYPDVVPVVHEMLAAARRGETVRREVTLARPAGPTAYLDAVLQPILGSDGQPGHLLLEARDVSELRIAQDQLRQAQKMEALGQLTGGIAHDFNNLLTVVVGGLDLIAKRAEDEAILRYARNALAAAERGVRLTGQLLAFSRVQRLEVRPVRVSALMTELAPLLRNVLGPGIEKRLEMDAGDPLIMADPTQLEVALLNLAINARDAMPDGGTLTLASRLAHVGEDSDLVAGAYVELAITDTGSGMPAGIVERAFEPFFTTKDIGKGTGLGLSMVYGMARQSGGTARIESEPGQGTTVRLFFRVAEAGSREQEPTGRDLAPADADAAPALVLVIDDDAQVRDHLVALLEDKGHRVIAAHDGSEGLALAEAHRPDLVVLDYMMPGMTGADVARELLRRRPGQPLLFVSGYQETEAIRAIAPDAPLLAKPFRADQLEAALNALL